MNSRTRRKIIISVFKEHGMHKFYISYLMYFLLMALVIMIFDPSIGNYGDSLWYCFASSTTIGFGDIAAKTFLSRILTVILYLYTAGTLAVTTALLTQVFFELLKARQDEAVSKFIYDLEHLQDLSKEELAAISDRIKGKESGSKKSRS